MLRLPLLLSFGAALAAQQTSAAPAANRFVPADSCLVARFAAPGAWREAFAKTQVAKLLQAPSLAPLVEGLTKQIDDGLAELRSSGDVDADLLEALLRDYRGEMVFSLQIDWSDLAEAMDADRPPAMSFVFALTPGEGVDLTKLATEIADFVERNSENRRPLRDVTVGDLRLRATADDTDWAVSVPAMVDGHLVMLGTSTGQDFEKTALRLLDTGARFDGDLGTQPLHVQARLGDATRELLSALTAKADEQGVPFDVSEMFRSMGFASFASASMSVGAENRRLAADFELRLGEDAQGILAAVMVDQQPKLLRYLPPSSDAFSDGSLDPIALFRTVKAVWSDLGEQVPMSFDQAMQTFTEMTKVRLEEDLIAHLGTEWLIVENHDDAGADPVDEETTAELEGSCIVIALRDGKAFGQSLETLLRARGMHAARKTEEYAGTKVYRLRPAGLVEVEYAVADDLLVLVVGDNEGARRNLRAVLDARAANPTKAELPAPLQALIDSSPAGWNGISVTPVRDMLRSMGTAVRTLDDYGEMPEEVAEYADAMFAAAADVERLGLDYMLTLNYASKRSLRTRLLW